MKPDMGFSNFNQNNEKNTQLHCFVFSHSLFKAGIGRWTKYPSSKFGRPCKLKNNTFQILRTGGLATNPPRPKGRGY